MRNIATGLVAIALGLAPTRAAAGPPDEAAGESDPAQSDPAQSDPTDEAIAQAEALYDKGAAKFETADYAAAVELWTEAYSLVPDTREAGQIKALLIYNIATAHEKAFQIDRDLAQLRKAKVLLEQFSAAIDDLYDASDAEAERTKVTERLTKIEAAIEAAEGDDAPAPPEPPPEDPDPTPEDPHPGRPLVISGAVLVGVGVAGLGVMAAGLGIGAGANDISSLDDTDIAGRRDQFARGRTGNTLAIAGGVAGGVFTAVGATLLGIGIAKNKKAPRASAWLRPGMAGVMLRGKF